MDDSYEDLVLNAIAEALSVIPDLQESPYMLPNATAPTAEILPGQIDYDEAFGPTSPHHFAAVVRVTVGSALDIAAQKKLRRFRAAHGPLSIKEAIEADRTLGGLTADLAVNTASPVRNFRREDGSTVMGCDFEIEFEGAGLL